MIVDIIKFIFSFKLITNISENNIEQVKTAIENKMASIKNRTNFLLLGDNSKKKERIEKNFFIFVENKTLFHLHHQDFQ